MMESIICFSRRAGARVAPFLQKTVSLSGARGNPLQADDARVLNSLCDYLNELNFAVSAFGLDPVNK